MIYVENCQILYDAIGNVVWTFKGLISCIFIVICAFTWIKVNVKYSDKLNLFDKRTSKWAFGCTSVPSAVDAKTSSKYDIKNWTNVDLKRKPPKLFFPQSFRSLWFMYFFVKAYEHPKLFWPSYLHQFHQSEKGRHLTQSHDKIPYINGIPKS